MRGCLLLPILILSPFKRHLVLSHFHWDHVLGFPFFHPLHVPGTTIHVYSAFPTEQLREHVRALFDGTYSPLRNLDNTAANVKFHRIPDEGILIETAFVSCQATDHSEESYAIRVRAYAKHWRSGISR